MNPSYVGDGNCEGAYNEEKYSIGDCDWDGGDCIEFNDHTVVLIVPALLLLGTVGVMQVVTTHIKLK